MATSKSTTHPSAAQGRATATTPQSTTRGTGKLFEFDEGTLEEVESFCECDPHGGPPVVVVNWAGAAIITSTFERQVFWGGVTLCRSSAYNLLAHLLSKTRMYTSTNLRDLVSNIIQALDAGNHAGLAFVVAVRSDRDLKRAKSEERGHLVQKQVEREAQLRGCGLGWYEDLYDRPEARLFVEALKSQTLYDPSCRTSMVDEFAMKINNGEWREYDITAAASRAWITEYFRQVGRNLGCETLAKFRSVLIGRVAKAAFRDATANLQRHATQKS